VSVFVLPKLYIHILKTGEQILSILLLGDYYFKKNPYEQRGFDVIIPALSIHCVSALTQNPSPACRLWVVGIHGFLPGFRISKGVQSWSHLQNTKQNFTLIFS